MTKSLKGKQATMFDTLAKKGTGSNSESEPQVELSGGEETKPVKQRRKRSKSGKRSDPAYTQIGCYLPRDLNNRVKVKLIGDPRDFSDLAAELLEQWLSD